MIRKLTCWLSLLMFTATQADELKIHGFVAQGLIQAADSNFVNNDGDLSLDLTEVGINASFKLSPQLRVAAQAVYLNGGNRYPQGLRLDYLFLDWQAVSNASWQLKMQLGRNKNNHWLYSSTRDVPHTRPSIILPQSIYFDAFRDVTLGVDGVALTLNNQNNWGDWDINLSAGTSRISDEQKANLLGQFASGDLKNDKDHQFSVYWRPKATHWLLGLSYLDGDFSYQPGASDLLFEGMETTKRLTLHVLYQGENWEFASELLRERVLFGGLLYPGFASDSVSEGGYAQLRYFLNQDLSLLTRLDMFDKDRQDRSGKKLEAASFGQVPRYFGYMDDATFGLSWKISRQLQLQGEYHRVKGDGRLAPALYPDLVSNDAKYWDIWALQLMYWF